MAKELKNFTSTVGGPDLPLHGRAAQLCQENGIQGMSVSRTDEGEYGNVLV